MAIKYTFGEWKKLREMGPQCDCKRSKQNGILKCGSVTDEDRNQIFRGFWSDMNWEQRRVYVVEPC